MRGHRFRVQFYQFAMRQFIDTGYGASDVRAAQESKRWRQRLYPINLYRIAVRVPAGRRVINANNS